MGRMPIFKILAVVFIMGPAFAKIIKGGKWEPQRTPPPFQLILYSAVVVVFDQCKQFRAWAITQTISKDDVTFYYYPTRFDLAQPAISLPVALPWRNRVFQGSHTSF